MHVTDAKSQKHISPQVHSFTSAFWNENRQFVRCILSFLASQNRKPFCVNRCALLPSWLCFNYIFFCSFVNHLVKTEASELNNDDGPRMNVLAHSLWHRIESNWRWRHINFWICALISNIDILGRLGHWCPFYFHIENIFIIYTIFHLIGDHDFGLNGHNLLLTWRFYHFSKKENPYQY